MVQGAEPGVEGTLRGPSAGQSPPCPPHPRPFRYSSLPGPVGTDLPSWAERRPRAQAELGRGPRSAGLFLSQLPRHQALLWTKSGTDKCCSVIPLGPTGQERVWAPTCRRGHKRSRLQQWPAGPQPRASSERELENGRAHGAAYDRLLAAGGWPGPLSAGRPPACRCLRKRVLWAGMPPGHSTANVGT